MSTEQIFSGSYNSFNKSPAIPSAATMNIVFALITVDPELLEGDAVRSATLPPGHVI
jgi:hypothetical protein